MPKNLGHNLLFNKAAQNEFQSAVVKRNFGGEEGGIEEDPDDIWSFPIGWNRNKESLTKEPKDVRFLSNAI